jgi:hypothetical protein
MNFEKHYVIIGAMKSGTTSVHEILNKHSTVSMTKFKEPNFFNVYHHKGLDWYLSLFKHGAEVTADASPNYTKSHRWPDTAKHLFDSFPNAKLIYIVRDPIDRIISHLHHDIHRDRLKPRNVNETVLRDNEYLMTSSYFFQISCYLKYFKRESMLIVPFEWLRDEPNLFMDELADFMGINKINVSNKLKFYSSEKKYLIKKFDWAKATLPPSLRTYYHRLFYLLSIKHSKPVLEENIKHQLKRKLKTDIDQFKSLCNYDFPEWKTYDGIRI